VGVDLWVKRVFFFCKKSGNWNENLAEYLCYPRRKICSKSAFIALPPNCKKPLNSNDLRGFESFCLYFSAVRAGKELAL
jgi:hypothetical protein